MRYPIELVVESIIDSDYKKLDRLKKFICDFNCVFIVDEFLEKLYELHCKKLYSKHRKLGRIIEFPQYSSKFNIITINLYEEIIKYLLK